MLKFANKFHPFFCVLHKRANFMWDTKADEAFKLLTAYVAHSSNIASPVQGETLHPYLAVSEQVVSAVLVVERPRERIPVSYMSHALAGAQVNYPLIDKFAYTLVLASQKLRPYFETYKVDVLTDQSLKNALQRLEASGRLLKWAVDAPVKGLS